MATNTHHSDTYLDLKKRFGDHIEQKDAERYAYDSGTSLGLLVRYHGLQIWSTGTYRSLDLAKALDNHEKNGYK